MTKSTLVALREILASALRLGCTSFGGPVAHLAYFRQEYVQRRRWLDDERYADLVSLSQFLPGPSSSQVGMAVGWLRGGWLGALVAWFGFTLPSAVFMTALAWVGSLLPSSVLPWFRGLPLVAVAVVALAIVAMAKQFLVDRKTTGMALLLVVSMALLPGTNPVFALFLAGVVGWLGLRPPHAETAPSPGLRVLWYQTVVPLVLFGVCLGILPLLRAIGPSALMALADSFYRAGALVFGGGHVVLPLLQEELRTLPNITAQDLALGYGWVQAVPGPLFSIAAYFGYLVGGVGGAIVATTMIFLPAYLLIAGVLPVWDRVRTHRGLRDVLGAVNAAVVGLLIWALYQSLWTTAVHTGTDFALAVVLFALGLRWNLAAWLLVLLGLAGGVGLQLLGL